MFVGISSTFSFEGSSVILGSFTLFMSSSYSLDLQGITSWSWIQGWPSPGLFHYRACADALPVVGHPDRPLPIYLCVCWPGGHITVCSSLKLSPPAFTFFFLDERVWPDKEQSSANWSSRSSEALELEFLFGLRHLTLTVSNIFFLP